MNPVIARVIAAVGLVLGIVSIWTDLLKPGPDNPSYWNVEPHNGVGIALLVFVALAGIGVLLALARGSALFDRLWLIVGCALGGFLLFFPVALTSESSLGHMAIGGWLGVATLVVFLVAGALLPLSAAPVVPAMTTTPVAPSEPAATTTEEPEPGA